ncbi:unnamed protein product [Lactuca virosa]|uniref:Uncharacterized protein n=1 Tax=Lactuca virosa TaxID=75947 RepID=A0AAU9M0G9_9ASTR|nr:unnamed protein product [Lactuca virosa]
MNHSCTLFLTPSTIFSKFAPKFNTLNTFNILTNTRKSSKISCSGADNSQNQQQQLNLSVLRFTLGIPGLDESYLPRWIGYTFGSLLILNHFLGSNSTTVTPVQLRTELLGLSLAAFSVMLPYIGQFLKGATPVIQANIPEGAEQICSLQKISSNSADKNKITGFVLLASSISYAYNDKDRAWIAAIAKKF